MRAEVLPLRTAHMGGLRRPLHTYAVPERLAATLEPGHLVSVPLGDRTTAGIVWALDAAADAAGAEDGEASAGGGLREVLDLLLPQTLLLPGQRALAEWIGDHYAAPLELAARLFLPPGLATGIRAVLRPAEGTAAESADVGRGDEAHVLGLLRERGWLERAQVEAALGRQRAVSAIGTLVATERVTLATELVGRLAGTRSQRLVRLAGAPRDVEAWRTEARRRLEALPIPPKVRPRYRQVTAEEREAERLLRQLAALDVLGRSAVRDTTHRDGADAEAWRVEELRRLTRATQGMLDELAAAGLIAFAEVEVWRDPLAGRDIPRTEPLPLTSAQAAALDAILDGRAGDDGNASHVVLLHGIT